jgi:hypothetical protein
MRSTLRRILVAVLAAALHLADLGVDGRLDLVAVDLGGNGEMSWLNRSEPTPSTQSSGTGTFGCLGALAPCDPSPFGLASSRGLAITLLP